MLDYNTGLNIKLIVVITQVRANNMQVTTTIFNKSFVVFSSLLDFNNFLLMFMISKSFIAQSAHLIPIDSSCNS